MRRDHSSIGGDAGQLQRAYWTLVMVPSDNQRQAAREALVETSYKEVARAPGDRQGSDKMYFAIVRQEVARAVSESAEIDGEIHALCDAL